VVVGTKRSVAVGTVPVFYLSELPDPTKQPCSIYRGVLVQWDEDFDNRVLRFIDGLDEYYKMRLVAVNENEGCLRLLWSEKVPFGYAEGDGVTVDGDYWSIQQSRSFEDDF
jgi:hypothetical protein